MDLQTISSLMKQFEDSDIRELKIDNGDFHLYLSKNKLNQANTSTSVKADEQNSKDENTKIVTNKPVSVSTTEKTEEAGKVVKAPIVGIVYLQAKPGQPSFINVGDHVKKGQTICIIEAMKMMTEVKSDLPGTVTKINVENEDLVEVDQPLITVKED